MWRTLVHLVDDGLLLLGEFWLVGIAAHVAVNRHPHDCFGIFFAFVHRRSLDFWDLWKLLFAAGSLEPIRRNSNIILNCGEGPFVSKEPLVFIDAKLRAIVVNRNTRCRFAHHLPLIGLASRYHLLPEIEPSLLKGKFKLRKKLLIGVFTRLKTDGTAEGLSRPHQIIQMFQFAPLIVVSDREQTSSLQEVISFGTIVLVLCAQVLYLGLK